MDAPQVATIAIGAAGALAALLAYFKYKPGQREAVDMTISQAHMNVAQGTFQLVTTELEDQFVRMSAELREVRKQHAADMAKLRGEFDQYRLDADTRMAELTAELRGERAEKRQVKLENVQLRERVDVLEAEVDRLKGRS